MKFEKTEVLGFEHALRGMRNPLESWSKSDSGICYNFDEELGEQPVFAIGFNDMQLAKKLVKAGSEHRKFLRQIFISVDITAPLYFWKEFDTYKIGTVANSTSTMHKLSSTPITTDCFEISDFENLEDVNNIATRGDWSSSEEYDSLSDFWERVIDVCEGLRQKYNETKDKRYWKELIRLLPESWLQKRTITMNYENVFNMYLQRQNHKLSEWSKDFKEWAESLPYFKELFLEQ